MQDAVLLTFEDTLLEGNTVALDVDRYPMVLVERETGTARVIGRGAVRSFGQVASVPAVHAPTDVDSVRAVRLAARVVYGTPVVHCVIARERAYIVELLRSREQSAPSSQGLSVLVPRGGPVTVVGEFLLPGGG